MSKYFLHDGQNQLGPFDKSELKEKKIAIDTPIWYEGLPDWTTAGELSELKDLFVLAPPPFKKIEKTAPILAIPVGNENIKPESASLPKKEDAKIGDTTKKKFKFGLLHYIIIGSILLIGIVSFIIYKSTTGAGTAEAENQIPTTEQRLEQRLADEQQKAEQRLADEQQKAEQERQRVALEQQKAEQERQRENTPERLRFRLLKQEQNSPTNYLSGSGTLVENITRHPSLLNRRTETDGYRIQGYVRNDATMAQYKDVVIVVHYYTKTMTLLSSTEFIIPEYFNPRSTTNFGPYKLYPPHGYATWSMEIKNASTNFDGLVEDSTVLRF